MNNVSNISQHPFSGKLPPGFQAMIQEAKTTHEVTLKRTHPQDSNNPPKRQQTLHTRDISTLTPFLPAPTDWATPHNQFKASLLKGQISSQKLQDITSLLLQHPERINPHYFSYLNSCLNILLKQSDPIVSTFFSPQVIQAILAKYLPITHTPETLSTLLNITNHKLLTAKLFSPQLVLFFIQLSTNPNHSQAAKDTLLSLFATHLQLSPPQLETLKIFLFPSQHQTESVTDFDAYKHLCQKTIELVIRHSTLLPFTKYIREKLAVSLCREAANDNIDIKKFAIQTRLKFYPNYSDSPGTKTINT